jgi:hypothetical protein
MLLLVMAPQISGAPPLQPLWLSMQAVRDVQRLQQEVAALAEDSIILQHDASDLAARGARLAALRAGLAPLSVTWKAQAAAAHAGLATLHGDCLAAALAVRHAVPAMHSRDMQRADRLYASKLTWLCHVPP